MVGSNRKIFRRDFCRLGLGGGGMALLPKLISAKEAGMQEKIKNSYGIVVRTENVQFQLYINGAPHRRFFRLEGELFSYPIAKLLRHGRNRIDLKYRPFNNEARKFEPHSGVKIHVLCNQNSGPEVTLANLTYDTEKARLVSSLDPLMGNGELRYSRGDIVGSKKFQEADGIILFDDGKNSGENTKQLTFEFEISDPSLRDVAWGETELLKDDEATRQELWQAYQRLHETLSNRDLSGYLDINEPLFDRYRSELNMSSNEEVAEEIFKQAPFGGGPGATVKPTLSASEARTARLYWGTTGRLVSFFDYWTEFIGQDGSLISSRQPFFARQRNGQFKVCYTKSI